MDSSSLYVAFIQSYGFRPIDFSPHAQKVPLAKSNMAAILNTKKSSYLCNGSRYYDAGSAFLETQRYLCKHV